MKRTSVGGRLMPSVVVVACLFVFSPRNASALAIIPNFIGGTAPGSTIGGGNLQDVFQAAADVWESVLPIDHTVHFDFGWRDLGPGVVGAEHILLEQGGNPNRETRGQIMFNNGSGPGVDPLFAVFLDPTPLLNEEFTSSYQDFTWDFGTGPINTGRVFEAPYVGVYWVDVFSVALHEIGHGLGMSISNTSWIKDAKDGDIDIRNPGLPFTGFSIPLSSNNAGITSHFDPLGFGFDLNGFNYLVAINGSLMTGGPSFYSRELPSDLDILALRQLNNVPEPSVMLLLAMGVGLLARRRASLR